MELLRRLYFFYAAVTVTVLLLSFCYAVDELGDEAGASTQATTLSSDQPITTLVNPATNIPTTLPLGSTLRAEEYIGIIRKQVLPNLKLTPDGMRLQIYKSTPFFMGRPIYATTARREIVEQALRDYGSVYIVDPDRNDSRLIFYDHDRGIVLQKIVGSTQRVIGIYNLDRNLHILRKYQRKLMVVFEEEKDVSAVPHIYGKPILSQGSGPLSQGAHSLGHMIRASKGNDKTFYYMQSGRRAILVDAHKETLYEDVTRKEQEEIEKVLNGYQTARTKYGTTLASIIWGQPIRLNPRYRESRIKDIPLAKYPRFFSEDSVLERDQMIKALQEHGRLHLYLQDTQGRNYAYKVKVKNPDAPRHEPMKLSIGPLGWKDKAAEKVQAWRGRISIPGPTRLAGLPLPDPV
ncbi:uncharacterized protein UTRI_04536 [Ustilago trichophora]|uniref:Uncharacterized protein n=1 Tax=Ustilago trichophora TaxID=86804 RepID=A0A5C3EDX8_9BASI|nr:uncharacterized protein UTRI_04536 [Ustilago trichophora]